MKTLGNQQKKAIRLIIGILAVLFFPCVACNRYSTAIDGRIEDGVTYRSTNGYHQESKLQRTGSSVHVMKYHTKYGTEAAETFQLSGNKLISISGEKVGSIKCNRSGKVLKVHLTTNSNSYSGFYTRMDD